MWKCKKLTILLLFALLFCLCTCQDDNRETKQHPELTKLVRNWAQKLGGELWHFGELVTRRSMVIDSFKDTTVVQEDGEALLKDIHEKISAMMKQKVEAVSRIMDIAEQAAKAQKDDDVDPDFQFYNAKNLTNSAPNYTIDDEDEQNDLPEIQELKYEESSSNHNPKGRYRNMVQPDEIGFQQDQNPEQEPEQDIKDYLDGTEEIEITDGTEKDPQASLVPIRDRSRLPLYPNRHFYNIPVNTNYSAVHVPSNVYERSKEVLAGIVWSEELDDTFRNNYKQDPTLSWQYFGSSSGFMRQFPAMQWHQEPIDLFDCRTRSWYIEAASSPKDIVILVDRSGSMTGMRREIARHVVHNILDTLGNNDFVNIFTFSNTTDPLIECFDNMLVQANMANVRILKEHMSTFKTEQIANFSLALITAFELLKDYRENKKGASCNQAIMLVTDGVQYNYKEIFEKYNWNLPFVNVRVFTYLIGREVSDVREVKWMACANQGYFVHLSTYAEVREEVLQYIPVMARPMVLNANQKPNPTWSPVYADVTDPKLTNWLWTNRQRNKQRERFLGYRPDNPPLGEHSQDKKFVHQQKLKQDNYGDLQTYHLMTSVSLPVYDKKPRKERVANLLGVAGTDVPIEYIQRLMLPYRLGVNGYAFMVTNNGYILTHPDLRPVYQGILKPAYNRVDLTEIEILDDDDADPRNFSKEILEFRRKVVMQKKGNVTLNVKYHLDEMRRVVAMRRHYFFMGVEGTPFSLVIAFPHRYGFDRVQHPVENDVHRIRSNDKLKGPFTQFFTGNWTIHPDWHYCRYLDDHHFFETPEAELTHFLEKMEKPLWKWTAECDRKLICKTVADAKITAWFSQNITTTSKEENGPEFIRRFGITVAFLAMHSGLTRWQDFPQNIDPNADQASNFHIYHNRAIDEVWYKRAVEGHYKDPRSFIYSVPFEIGNENNTLVTVSHAIFRDDGMKKAPAAVVGYQFYHSALYSLFRNITTNCGDMQCTRTCDSKELHCLMLDDNGYVIVSNNIRETGYFFGRIRPDIMKELINGSIYKVTRMYDYQGLCPEEEESTSPASRLLSPLTQFLHIVHGIYTTLQLILIELPLFFSFSQASNDDDRDLLTFYRQLESQPKYIPCDKRTFIYSLIDDADGNVIRTVDSSIHTHKIADSNLLLLIIEGDSSDDLEWPYSIFDDPFDAIAYKEPLECKINRNPLRRVRYGQCFDREPVNETERMVCSQRCVRCSQSGLKILIFVLISIFIFL